MKSNSLHVLILILIILLTGCIPSKEIESLGIINTRGVDLLENNNLKTTIVYFQFDAQSKEISKIVYGEGDTVKGARVNANLKTNFELTPGQIRLEIYGIEAANKGLMQYLDTLARDAKVADTMFLSVSNTTAEEVITMGEDDASSNVGHYLYRLIEQTVDDDIIPRTTLQDFIHKYYDVGKDPMLPLLKVKEGRPYLYAMALFKGDKYAGEISMRDAFLINILENRVESTLVELELPLEPFKKYLEKPLKDSEETFSVLLSVLNGHGNSSLVDVSNLEFEANVKMDFRLLELSKEIKLEKPEVETILEKEIEKKLKQEYNKILNEVKKIGSDPFGFGKMYRVNRNTGKLTDEEWRSIFPNIKVAFHIDAKIIRHGITQ